MLEPFNSGRHSGRFDTTSWTVILDARDRGSPRGQEALAALCESYWYPVYAYIRRRGHDADQAQDLTQEFFGRLLDEKFLGSVGPEKGRFRSFLLAACKNFLANEHNRRQAHKRGGGRQIVSFDAGRAEERYRLEPSHDLTPERLYERRWALTLLEQAVDRLRKEFLDAGRGELFDRLKPGLVGDCDRAPYSVVAGELGMTEGAVQVAAHRLRRRYQEILRLLIAGTIEDAAQVDDEIRDMFAALGSR